MRCPYCKTENDRVIDTRPSVDGTRRRRECLQCGKRFTTHERLADIQTLVIKKSGKTDSFRREKLEDGIRLAAKKRPISDQMIQAMVESVEQQIFDRDQVTTRELGEMVMSQLRAVDEVAYIRFASVYRDYQAVDEFVDEIRSINPKSGRWRKKKSEE